MATLQKNNGIKKMPSARNRLGFGYFIAAIIFLANPCINIIDILPDFFGYLFLIAGLSKWADLCPNTSVALQGIKRLRWFMLLKLLLSLLVPVVDDTFVLVFTFSFAVIELIYVLPAASKLFDGLEYFGTRFDGKAVFANLKTLRSLTGIYFVLKSVFCVLPELCSLGSSEYYGYITSTQVNVMSFKAPLMALNLFMCALLAILWLVNALPYINRLSKDTPFLIRVLHDYEVEVGNNTGLAIRRTVHTAISFIIAGCVFFPNLWMDGVNVIPTFVGAVFLTAAAVTLSKASHVSKTTIIAQIVFAVMSAASYALALIFELRYGIDMIQYSFEAYDFYSAVTVFSVMEYITMVVAVFMMYKELRRLTRDHLGAGDNVTDKRLTDIYTRHLHEADRGIISGFVVFWIMLAVNAVYSVMRADLAPQYYLIPLAVTVIWLVFMGVKLRDIDEQIEYKYM